MRLIDAEALKQKAVTVEKLDGNGCPYEFLAVPLITIKNSPTIEAKPIVHAHWFLLDDCANEGVYCSACTKKVYKTNYANQKLKSKYCPNCGALMDEEVSK